MCHFASPTNSRKIRSHASVFSLGGFGIAEHEPFESQSRGFQHGHRKVFKTPATREQEVPRLFREQDPTVLHGLLQKVKQAMISCAESLQYEASTLPAAQMRQDVLREQFTRKQQLQSRLDGGVELDGSRRQLLETTPQELRAIAFWNIAGLRRSSDHCFPCNRRSPYKAVIKASCRRTVSHRASSTSYPWVKSA